MIDVKWSIIIGVLSHKCWYVSICIHYWETSLYYTITMASCRAMNLKDLN
jgi:hypothetical protein